MPEVGVSIPSSGWPLPDPPPSTDPGLELWLSRWLPYRSTKADGCTPGGTTPGGIMPFQWCCRGDGELCPGGTGVEPEEGVVAAAAAAGWCDPEPDVLEVAVAPR